MFTPCAASVNFTFPITGNNRCFAVLRVEIQDAAPMCGDIIRDPFADVIRREMNHQPEI